MNYLLIGVILVLVLNVFFGVKEGLWDAAVTLVTLLLFVFMMNFVLPNYIEAFDTKEEIILESELNRKKDMNDVISILPDKIEKYVLKGYSSYDEVMSVDPELGYMIAGKLASFGVIIAMIITLLFALFVLRPIGSMYNLLSKFPVLKKLDKVIGMGVGVVNGILMIYMILIGIAMFSATDKGALLYGMVSESEILMSLYEKNIVLKLFF